MSGGSMFLARRPSPRVIASFLEVSRDLPLSYDDPHLLAQPPPGYDVDDASGVVGHGEADFERARQALDQWRHFELSSVRLHRDGAAIAPGLVVAMESRHLGFWSLNGCRVLRMAGERGGAGPYGFVYGTLTCHAEQGEELFEVSLAADGSVTYRLHAVSRPRALPARLGYPYVRHLQARFRRESIAAMERAVAEAR